MFILYRFFNSIIFMFINLTVGIITCKRFFQLMKSHYKLMAEVAEFNEIVRQSRQSLDYMNSEVSETMKEIEGDIGKELYVTHNLTKISSKMGMILRRFNALEEGVIELVRMDHNMESIKIATPNDINTEVKKILVAARKKEKNVPERPKTPKKLKISASSSRTANDTPTLNTGTKFPSAQSSIHGKPNTPENRAGTPRDVRGKHSEVPIVKLLIEKKKEKKLDEKPIGFRPSWKCET